MSKLDICTCTIRLDDRTTVVRGITNPMNYVEVEMSLFQFGERAISDLNVIGYREKDNSEVLENLRIKYGAQLVAKAFPGQRPRLPMEAPDDIPHAKDQIDFDRQDAISKEEYDARRAKNMGIAMEEEIKRKTGKKQEA